MGDKKPTIRIEPGVRVAVTLVEQPEKFRGKNGTRAWFGWNVKDSGVEKVIFADSKLNGELVLHQGKLVVIECHEGDTGGWYYKVGQSMFDEKGTMAQKPKEVKSDDYRENRRQLLKQAIVDVMSVEDDLLAEGYSVSSVFTPETRQRFATTLLIQAER